MHFWSFKNNLPASPNELAEYNAKCLEQKKKRKKGADQAQISMSKERELELFGRLSDSAIVSPGDDESDHEDQEMRPDVEPSRAETSGILCWCPNCGV